MFLTQVTVQWIYWSNNVSSPQTPPNLKATLHFPPETANQMAMTHYVLETGL